MDYFSRVGKIVIGLVGLALIEGVSSGIQASLREGSKARTNKMISETKQVFNITKNQLTQGYDIEQDDKFNF